MAVRTLEDSKPVTGNSVAGLDNLLPASLTNARFDLVHYPMGWSYDEKRGFLPDLGQITHMPAVNGVRDTGKDRDGKPLPPDATAARAGSQRKGGTLILPTDNRLGDFHGFLRYAECDGGGLFYFFTGTAVEVWGKAENQHRVVESPKWTDFLQYLRDKRIVDPISKPAYDRLRATEAEGLAAYRAHTGEWAEVQRKAIQKRLDGMAKEWEKLNKSEAVTVNTIQLEGKAV